MKIKKPSLTGMSCTEYLGRFQKDEFIQQGHNFSGRPLKLDQKNRPTADLVVSLSEIEDRNKKRDWKKTTLGSDEWTSANEDLDSKREIEKELRKRAAQKEKSEYGDLLDEVGTVMKEVRKGFKKGKK